MALCYVTYYVTKGRAAQAGGRSRGRNNSPFHNFHSLGFRATYRSGKIVVDGQEIERAGWYPRNALPEIPRPGTVAHSLITRWLQE